MFGSRSKRDSKICSQKVFIGKDMKPSAETLKHQFLYGSSVGDISRSRERQAHGSGVDGMFGMELPDSSESLDIETVPERLRKAIASNCK